MEKQYTPNELEDRLALYLDTLSSLDQQLAEEYVTEFLGWLRTS